MWPYADLSALAKSNGGPEKFVDKVFENGRKFGRKEMYPVIGGGFLCGSLITLAVQKGIQLYKDSREYAVKEAAKTKEVFAEELKKEISSAPVEHDKVSEEDENGNTGSV